MKGGTMGKVRWKMSMSLDDRRRSQPKRRQGFNGFHPIGRIGQPEDVAEVICFLLSDKGVVVDGGDLGCRRRGNGRAEPVRLIGRSCLALLRGMSGKSASSFKTRTHGSAHVGQGSAALLRTQRF
jgi:hypothetical protein